MQTAYITALYDLMEKDANVVSLLSDSGTDYDVMLAREFPEQCFNFGIAEQNKIGVASGMAAVGKIPFVYTTGAFLAYRAYEFIRNDICFQNRNVKMMGVGMGADMGGWSTLGASHHTTEDVSALRALPNLTLLSAATPIELQQCVQIAYAIKGPVYVRMGMSGEPEFYDESYKFALGSLSKLQTGDDIVIFSTGTILPEVMQAAKYLNQEGISTSIYNVPTLKPLNKAAVIDAISGNQKIFTIEEHTIYGGLGSIIAEIIAEAEVSIPLVRIGLNDVFATGYGKTAEVRKMNALDAKSIYKKIVAEVSL